MFENQIIHRNTVSGLQPFPFVLAKLQEYYIYSFFCIDFSLFLFKYSYIFLNFQKWFLVYTHKNSVFSSSVPLSLLHNTPFHIQIQTFSFYFDLFIFIAQIDVCSAVRLYSLCLLQNNWPVKYLYLL